MTRSSAQIRPVSVGDPALQEVVKLWRANSATLGFMPDGGFESYARAGGLLGAFEKDGSVLGYLMYRVARRRHQASIAHLCVTPTARGRGLARTMFDVMRSRLDGCCDVTLKCRRDYEVDGMWQRLGFVARGEVEGRGRDGGKLTLWRYDLRELPLFEYLSDRDVAQAVQVVIDANVFFDLGEGPDNKSCALSVDWLQGEIDLVVTPELFNEIHRQQNREARERARVRARSFPSVRVESNAAHAIVDGISSVLDGGEKPSAKSDALQIAYAIASGAAFFVTRDGPVLDVADDLYDVYGIRVMAPHEVVLHFDELRREDEYAPRRLPVGPSTTSARPTAADTDLLVALVHDGHPAPEPKTKTVERLHGILSTPDRYDFSVVRADGEVFAAYAVDRQSTGVVDVPFFGVANSAMGRTAARHFLEHIVVRAVRDARRAVVVSCAGRRLLEPLHEAGFHFDGARWVKLAFDGVMTASTAHAEITAIGSSFAVAAAACARVQEGFASTRDKAEPSSETLRIVERTLWPAKLRGAEFPTYIVPIRPQWAHQLFDYELASGTLFGANPDLALRAANAYFRAARGPGLTAPSRILWYVSDDAAYQGSMAIRACSYVDEVVIDSAKRVFGRYRRLGIYKWKNVREIVDHEHDDVMGFEFGRTELFSRPISHGAAQQVLARHGHSARQNFQGPVRISESCFFEFYEFGMNLMGTADAT